MSPRLRRLGVMLAFGAAGAAIVLLSIPVCPTARLLRIPCPGCGLSRATFALLRGHPHDAWHLHPGVFFVLPVIGLYLLGQMVTYVQPEWTRLQRALASRTVERIMIVLMVLMIALWLSRFLGAFGGPVPV